MRKRSPIRPEALFCLILVGACGPLPTGPAEGGDEPFVLVTDLPMESSCPSCDPDELADLERSAYAMRNSGCQYATALGGLYDDFMGTGMIDISGYYDYGGDHGEMGYPHGSIGIDVTIGYETLNNEDIDQSWVTHVLAEELMHHYWYGQCPTSGWNEDCEEEGPNGGPGVNQIANSCGGTEPDWPERYLDE